MHAPNRRDIAALLKLATPIVAIQVGMMLMGVVDTIMVGQLSAEALAAVAIANIYYFGITVFGIGALFALDPIVAQALGANDSPAVQHGLQRGLLLSLILSVPIMALLLAVEPALRLAQQPAEIVPIAAEYVYRVIPSVWPFYAFVVLRQTLQAHQRTAPIVWTIVIANVVNAVLNYAWIFGELGLPALGVAGSAWATTVSRWLMAALLLALGWRVLSPYLARRVPELFALRPLWRMLRIGVPIGGQMLLEVGVFGTIALFMGTLGVVQVAAHQVAINIASLTFMVPLGVSSAAAVLVGHAVGRGDHDAMRRATTGALLVGGGFMTLTAALLIGAPGPLAAIYTDDEAVLALTVVLLPLAGIFQVFDGLQVVALGLLRGLGDTCVPMIVNVIGFWVIGMPVSLWLGFGLDLGAVGLWWGLVAGLVMVAAFLLVRLGLRTRRTVERVVIDEMQQPRTSAVG